MNHATLVRPEILALKPYVSARSSAAADGVLLNANEAPEPLLRDPAWAGLAIHRYPDPQPADLVQRLAALYDVEPARLLVTRGSDEGIDLLVRVFCRAQQDAVLECPPCFGMYRIAAQVQGAEVVTVPRDPDSLCLDLDALVERIGATPNLKLVFLTSPNNPTGDLITEGEMGRVLEACADRALLVLDEAYIEFCETPSAAARVTTHPQLVVLRTLSKAWAAAGLRCGAVIADPAVIDFLRRVMAPYPLTAPAIAAALEVTGPDARARQAAMLGRVRDERERLRSRLDSWPWVRRQWPAEANFILARVDDAPGLVKFCAGQGVRIRDFSAQPMLEQCVRFSIGSRDDMEALYRALDAWGGKA